MAKIFINNEWYYEIEPKSLYESEYENILIQYGESIYQDYFIVPFKVTVYSDDASARADLAFVSKNYQEWWVVEVEKHEHSLKGHVLPQVRTLSQASYGRSEAEYLSQKHDDLEVEKLMIMMKGVQPKVLVVVNKLKPEWVFPLSQYNAEMAVIEVFVSDRNYPVFRVNGYEPMCSLNEESECSFNAYLKGFLEIHSPVILDGFDNNIYIKFNGSITIWKKVETSDCVWLIPKDKNPLDVNKDYKLIKCQNNSLMLSERY